MFPFRLLSLNRLLYDFFSFVCEIKNLDNGNCHQSEIKKNVPHNNDDDDINNRHQHTKSINQGKTIDFCVYIGLLLLF